MGEIVQDSVLMTKIRGLISQEFDGFLPDVSTGDEFFRIINELLGVGNGEDFVTIALKLTTNAIAGKIINIPNMFDLWSGQTLHSTDVNTVIIAKEYRGYGFLPLSVCRTRP